MREPPPLPHHQCTRLAAVKPEHMVHSMRKNVAVLVMSLSPVKVGAKQHCVKRKDKRMS